MSEKKRQIIVMGGGGFSMEPRNPRMDDYIIAQTGQRRPRICFVGTASGDSKSYIARFYHAFPKTRAETSHLPLFVRDGRDLRESLLSQHIIYVGGGNTANLLMVWRLHGVDRIMREAWRRGIVLCGVSAGMLCWFEGGVTDSFGPLAALRDGLGLLPGSACPHYNGEGREPTYLKLVSSGMSGGFAAEDGAALHFVGRRLHACIASKRSARAFRVERAGRSVVETPLSMHLLESRA